MSSSIAQAPASQQTQQQAAAPTNVQPNGNGNAAPQAKQKPKPRRRGKGGQDGQKVTPTGSSSITASMRSISGGSSVLFVPENTFYLINLPAFLLFALRFDGHLRSLSRRRPGHPQHHEYAALIVFALLAKLCRVGVATAQLPLSATEICDASWILLPPVIAGIIGTYGQFTDTNHVLVAPRITRSLLNYLYRVIHGLCDADPAVRGNTATIANHRDYLHDCYGISSRVQAIANNWVQATGTASRFRCGGVTQAELRLAAGLMLTEHAVRNANIIAPSAGVNFETYGLPGDTSAGDCAAIFDAANAPLVAATLQQAAQRFNNPAAPLGANALAIVLQATFPSNGPVDVYSCRASVQYFTSIYDVVPIDVGPDGSCSPTVVLEQSGNGFTAATVAMCLSVQEAIVGCLIGNDHVFWTDRRGVIYSFHANNQTVRVHTTPFAVGYDSFRVRAFQDGLRAGTY